MKKKYIIIYCFVCICGFQLGLPFNLRAQNVDLETVGGTVKEKIGKITSGEAFKISGGISANSIFYNSSEAISGRDPFVYFLQGNLTLGFLHWSMPISYSFTNQGRNLAYEVPFKFNRLSLNPRYKWIQGYIGDVTMNFSPYTMNGHLFTGAGLELSPDLPVKISVMGGRFLKATERDTTELRTVPAFERMGYGAKVNWEKESYSLGLITFHAKDDIHSIQHVPDDLGVTPKENLVISFEGKWKLPYNIELFAEYASSAMTNDLRAEDVGHRNQGLSQLFLNNKSSTEVRQAYKGGVNMALDQMTIGIHYERIDPEYTTLGAYYFNNDFENIVFNATRNLADNKLTVALNLGYEHDNLEEQKDAETGRVVGSINVTAQLNEKLNITASASNFTSFTNMKINQFDYINDPIQMDNSMDTLDYKQIARNANLNINYALASSESKNQTITLNYVVNDIANEEGGIVRVGGGSTVHSAALMHAIAWIPLKLNLSSSLNYTYNTIGAEDAQILGFSLGLSKKVLEDKCSISLTGAYNRDNAQAGVSEITHINLNTSYSFWEKHNLSLGAIQMFRKTTADQGSNTNDLTVTVGYTYSF